MSNTNKKCCCETFNVKDKQNKRNCSEICANTRHSNVFFSIPAKEDNPILHSEYLLQLGLEKVSKNSVVCGSHFLDDDVVKVGKRHKLNKTTCSTTNNAKQPSVNSMSLPPIPCQSLHEVKDKKSIGTDKSTGLPMYPQILKDSRTSFLKRNLSKQNVDVLVKAYRSSRKNSVRNSIRSYFVGSTKLLFDLIQDIHYHSKKCRGAITIPSKSVTTKNLAQRIRIICKCGRGCAVWGDTNNGAYVYTSDELIKVPLKTDESKYYEDYSINFKQAVASIATPASRRTVRQVLQCLQLGSIDIKKERKYHRQLIHPNIVESYNTIVAEKFKVLEQGSYIILSIDTSFDAVRLATSATTVLCDVRSNEVIAIIINTDKIPAIKKEYINTERIIKILSEHELDIWSITSDKSPKVQKMLVESKVAAHVLLDNWHIFTKLSKHIQKNCSKVKEELVNKLLLSEKQDVGRKTSKKDPLDGIRGVYKNETIIGAMLKAYESKFNEYNADLIKIFESSSDSTYGSIRFDANKENSWAEQNKLLWNSSNLNLSYEGSKLIIDLYNKHYESDSCKQVKVLEQVKICAVPVSLLTEIYKCATSNLSCKAGCTKKEDMIDALKVVLPEDCFRGSMWSSDIASVCADIRNFLPTEDDSEWFKSRENDFERKKAIRDRHGLKSGSKVSGVDKEGVDSLYKDMYTYVKGEEPPLQKVSLGEKKQFCANNMSKLNNNNDTLRQAADIANRVFSERVGEFKRHYNTCLRQANETYDGYSAKFRIFYVVSALLNYSQHCCNNHQRCNQWIWHSRCAVSTGAPPGSKCLDSKYLYVPEKGYVNTRYSSSKEVDDLVPLLFKLLTYAFALGAHSEQLIYKVIDYTRTSINESFNHHDRIMMTKGRFFDALETEVKGLMSFIAFDGNQKQKVRSSFKAPKLVHNKHNQGLVPIQFASKIEGDHRYIQEFLQKTLGDYSPCTKENAQMRLDKISSGIKKKEIKVEETKEDILKDPVLANLNTTIARRVVHSASVDIVGSARPCPPFPFKYVNFRVQKEVNSTYLLLVDKTFQLKESLKKKAISYLNRCFVCRDELKEVIIDCINCHRLVCKPCMDSLTGDSVWIDTKKVLERTADDLDFEEQEEEYEYLCNTCYKDDNNNEDTMTTR